MKPRTGFVPSITAAPPAPPPLHHCAGQRKDRSPACGLQAATSSSSEPRRHAVKLRHGSISPAIAVPPAPTFALSALPRVLPAACAVSIKPLTASAATLGGRSPFALRGPPPLTCGEADGYDAGSCQPARSRPCHLLHCASIRRLRGQNLAAPRPHSCSIPQVAHGQGKPAARDCQSNTKPVCASRLLA